MSISGNMIYLAKHENMQDSISLPPPSFGYTVQLTKAVTIRRNIGNVSAFNHGINNDFRTVDFTLQLNKNDVIKLRDFFDSLKNISSSKNEFYFKTSKNFFAAGPDQPDEEIFHVAIAGNPQFSSMMINPFEFFKCQLRLLFIDLPIIVPLSQNPEPYGSFDFGSVKGLRDPERSPSQDYAAERSNSLSGDHFVKHSFVDEYTTSLSQVTTTLKMAELLYFLQSERTAEITIKAGKNYWLFGPDICESGEIEVKLLDNQFIFTHEGPDRWRTNINIWHVKKEHDFA